MPIQLISKCAPIAIVIVYAVSFSSSTLGEEPPVKFDVPAIVGVHEIEFAEGHQSESNTQKIIEVLIPVTTEISIRDRDNVDEFRFDVYWNRNIYPLADYAPKTQTVSSIDGFISVEKSQDRNAGVGINLSSSFPEVVSGTAKADLSQRSGTKFSYQEVPQHELLVASGTVQRGTGAFFRFHPSKRETLEGGRDLIVAYRVPQSWRGGVIKIECRASGHRKIVGSWREPFEESRAFVLPIYLEGDDQARQAAEDFVRSEQGLRQNWKQHQTRTNQNPSGLFSFATTNNTLPSAWMHQLIQSGSDTSLNRYRGRLPDEVVDAAEQFVVARNELFKFSR